MPRSHLLLALLGLALLAPGVPAAPAQPPGASTTPAQPTAMASKYVEPCQCSAAEKLPPSQAVVFNCECGAMKCVVTAVAANNAKDSPAPSLVCR